MGWVAVPPPVAATQVGARLLTDSGVIDCSLAS